MQSKMIQEILTEILPFYTKLGKDVWEKLNTSASFNTYAPNTVLHAGRDDCSGLLFIKSGRIRAYIVTEDGKEITLFRLLERDVCIFSASCMLKNITFDIWISAETEVEALQIPSKVFQDCTQKEVLLSNFMNDIVSSRMSDVMWILEQTLFSSFDKRLAVFLLEQAALEESSTFKITHEQIANHLGSAREVVSRMLKYFSGEGIIQAARGTIIILDENALQKVSGL